MRQISVCHTTPPRPRPQRPALVRGVGQRGSGRSAERVNNSAIGVFSTGQLWAQKNATQTQRNNFLLQCVKLGYLMYLSSKRQPKPSKLLAGVGVCRRVLQNGSWRE